MAKSFQTISNIEYLLDIVDYYRVIRSLKKCLLSIVILCFLAINGDYAKNIVGETKMDRSLPSIFQAWNSIENLSDESEIQRLARHDLAFAHPYTLLKIHWDISDIQPYSGLATNLSSNLLSTARQRKKELLSLNPHLLLLVEIRYRDAKYMSAQNEGKVKNWWEVGYYPPDSPYWLKDKTGNPVIGWGEDTDGDKKIDKNDEILNFLIDFTNPKVQELIVKQAASLNQSGLFNGIMLDWWSEDFATSPIGVNDWSETILTPEAELKARLSILRKIRAQVDDDFLILVNSNMRQIPKSTPYVNGIFMECYKQDYDKGYNLNQIKQMEKTLLWAEEHLREPRINCLEGWRTVTDYMGDGNTRIAERNNERNLQWMRMITTLSLTHSDGYVLFADDSAIPSPDHLHNWYGFWDVNLGRPIQKKAVEYKGVTGLFVREFEKGWAVYNRNSTKQDVSFNVLVKGVSSSILHLHHEIPAFDGDIFLKQNDEK